jgi:hypothetical protein
VFPICGFGGYFFHDSSVVADSNYLCPTAYGDLRLVLAIRNSPTLGENDHGWPNFQYPIYRIPQRNQNMTIA